MSAVAVIARLEFSAATRQRWVRLFVLTFALLSVVIASSAGAAEELSGPEGFSRTSVSLVPLALLLVPLAALLLGVTGNAGEAGNEAYLFAQPVTRGEVILGKWVGQLAALSAAVALGLGAGGVFLAASAGLAGIERFLFVIVTSVVLGAVFLSLAAAITSAIPRRGTALGLASFVWFLFVLLYDGVALGVAGWSPGRTGARVLFVSVFGNPADLARVLTLQLAGSPHVLGAAGEAWNRFLGGATPALVLASVALLAWAALPLAAAQRCLRRRDL
ncbi:MAG TPA: ABC transporter permease [Thermoanaerobaculia bacterium]|nr:ABC transporter permease [Thermoanaerobaculia bacterium]